MSGINVTDWENEKQVKIHIKGESEGWIEGEVIEEYTDENNLYLMTKDANNLWIKTSSIDSAKY